MNGDLAYCPLFEVYVDIQRQYPDSDGRAIYVGTSECGSIKDHLFRAEELEFYEGDDV